MSSLLSHKSIRISKPTHGHQPDKVTGQVGPVDVLIDRSQQWKHITKSLLHYYKGLAAIEASTAKATSALTETIQVPFHEGNNFLGDGGWQEVLYEVRDKTNVIAQHHSSLSTTLEQTVVKELEGVRSELKAHIAAIEKEAGVLATEVEKERAHSATLLTGLSSGIETFETSQHHMMAKDDPYIVHTQTQTQLAKQVHKENDLQAALIRFQQQQPEFEASISKSIQSACAMYDEAKTRQEGEIQKNQQEIYAALQKVEPDAEYKFYASHEGAVLDPNTPFRSIEAITFPGHNHAATAPLKEGILERKKRFTKSYKEAYYVLTPSGYLHERKSNDDVNAIKPTFSLFLPECSLGAPAKETDKSHKFHVEGNKAIKSSFEGKVKSSLRFGGKEIAYSFRSRTHHEMLGWWGEMDKLSRDTKASTTATASKNVAVSPITAAVANVGYAPASSAPTVTEGTQPAAQVASATTGTTHAVEAEEEEEEEDDDEEGGSSAEEEEELARTAPSTPAVTGHTSAPVFEEQHEAVASTSESHEEEATSKAEVLPTYTGDGTTEPEKAALTEKGKPSFLGSVFGTSS